MDRGREMKYNLVITHNNSVCGSANELHRLDHKQHPDMKPCQASPEWFGGSRVSFMKCASVPGVRPAVCVGVGGRLSHVYLSATGCV